MIIVHAFVLCMFQKKMQSEKHSTQFCIQCWHHCSLLPALGRTYNIHAGVQKGSINNAVYSVSLMHRFNRNTMGDPLFQMYFVCLTSCCCKYDRNLLVLQALQQALFFFFFFKQDLLFWGMQTNWNVNKVRCKLNYCRQRNGIPGEGPCAHQYWSCVFTLSCVRLYWVCHTKSARDRTLSQRD